MTWYVNPKTGNDASDGKSAETAFRNVSRAIEAASAGDTILLAPGPYDEDLPKRVGAARLARISIAVLGGH